MIFIIREPVFWTKAFDGACGGDWKNMPVMHILLKMFLMSETHHGIQVRRLEYNEQTTAHFELNMHVYASLI